MASKRGSVIVFLSMLFAALSILIFAFIHQAIDRGIDSCVDSLGRVWGLNILSEYDVHLYKDYGILAFYGDEKRLENTLDYYAKASLADKKYIKYAKANVNLGAFSLLDPNNFQLAIEDSVHMLKNKKIQHSDRAIVNQRIIGELPSNQDDREMLIEDNMADTVFFLINHFGSHNKVLNEKSFFRNEQEYLVCGRYSDEENYRKIRNRYVAERVLSNSAFIHTQADMMAETLALANVLTPGVKSKLTQEALIEGWATRESENDWKIIEDGGRVPNFKTKSSWALKLGESGYVKKNNPSGLKYEDYLKILLLQQGEERLIYRMMDLVQINMKYAYYGDFLMADYNAGLAYSFMVNNKEHDFSKEYKER